MIRNPIIDQYLESVSNFDISAKKLSQKVLHLSLARFAVFALAIIFLYFTLATSNKLILILFFACVGLFLFLLKKHGEANWELQIVKKKSELLNDEIEFLKTGISKNNPGLEFIDFDHPYTYDLDIFGHNSLYQFINRTVTFKGHENLAHRLKNALSKEDISETQVAIDELTTKESLRLQFSSLGSILKDDKEEYQKLISWIDLAPNKPILNKWILSIMSFIPVLSITAYYFLDNEWFLRIFTISTVLNSFLLFSYIKTIISEISITDKVVQTTKKYSFLLEIIERENFSSPLLQKLQKEIHAAPTQSSQCLKEFSSILNSLDSIINVLPTTIINSLTLFHIHQYNNLLGWKQKYHKLLPQWVEVLGHFDSLHSFARFNDNHPQYTLPSIGQDDNINFEALGHPLIPTSKSVTNDIRFDSNFYILTGSNMSGKSTFLRSIGVNLVLAMAGSRVCATKMTFKPVELWTSMRQSDALFKNYSYFFSEVKRLKLIFDHVNSNSFVLLDEILKGTNSEDKKYGSIEVSKRLITKNINGIIATHDIEVASLSNQFRNVKQAYFQSEVINNDIVFDYKLRDGVCTSKSATFLLKKEGVIS